MEDESDDSDGEDKDPSYTEVPGTSADDQAGPSGVGKDGVEAPKAQVRSKARAKSQKIQCCACGRSFTSKPQIERHFNNLTIKVLIKCLICQRLYPPGSYCDHEEHCKIFHCEFCGIRIDQPLHLHACFHLNANKIKNIRQKKPDPEEEELLEVKIAVSDLDYLEDTPDLIEDLELPPADTSSDIDDTDTCIYCNTKMLSVLLSKHEAWHRKYDKNVVRQLTDTRSSRLQRNSEGLCAYCGVLKPGNKLRRHEYVEHVKKYVRKVCDICGIFTCPTYIKEHMRTHGAEKGFKCGDCGKAFFRKKALARHKLVHTDVAQYMCTVCGKAFKIKFNLRVHMRSHEDIKPFPCSVCKKTFTTKQWRDNHLKTHGIVGNR